MAIFMYRERMALEEDPYRHFMNEVVDAPDPHGTDFTFRDPFKELPVEIQRA
jgi:hypothetical protein